MNTPPIITLSGPSGTGKDTIVNLLLPQISYVGLNISATTRERRQGEVDGVDYYFYSVEQFQEKISQNRFLEYEEVYDGLYYGTLLSEIQRIRSLNKIPLLIIDVVGAMNIKTQFKKSQLAIFLAPPSIEELEARLRSRKTESDEKIQQRMETAHKELSQKENFDIVVINDIVNNTVEEIKGVIKKFADSQSILK